MLQVAICDDDRATLERYAVQLERLAVQEQLGMRLTTYPSGEALLFALEDLDWRLDIVYLDVQMPGLDGIETARRLRAAGCEAQILFLTNSRDEVFESFDVRPLQYLLKGGLTMEKFRTSFMRAVQLCGRQQEALFVCERGAERRAIPFGEITYFEVIKRIVTVHYAGGGFAFYSSMGELERRLPPGAFVRTHRAFLVALSKIRRLDQESLGLTNGVSLPLGRTYIKQVREQLSRYLSGGEGGEAHE